MVFNIFDEIFYGKFKNTRANWSKDNINIDVLYTPSLFLFAKIIICILIILLSIMGWIVSYAYVHEMCIVRGRKVIN